MNNENSPNTTTLENFQNLGIKVLEEKATSQVTGGQDIDIFSDTIATATNVIDNTSNNTIALDLGTLDLL